MNREDKYPKCYVCLNMLNDPLQCSICESILCKSCFRVFTILNKKCFSKCNGEYKKANKYIRAYLSTFKIKCIECFEILPVEKYFHASHMGNCFPKQNQIDDIFTSLIEKETMLQSLEKMKEIHSQLIKNAYIKYYTQIQKLDHSAIRDLLMSDALDTNKKMEFYYACRDGKLEDVKHMIITKKYPILEEISASGYYWTALHYSMHYGQLEVICYLCNILIQLNIFAAAMKIQSNDGRCPVLCLMKSDIILTENKEKLMKKIIDRYHIILSQEVKNEIVARNFCKLMTKFK